MELKTGAPATAAAVSTKPSGYTLKGSLIEACTCDVLCPCWIGEDPDNGTCEGMLAYHFDKGNVNGVDVNGLNMIVVALIPGNVLAGNWRVLLLVDDRATDEQLNAILAAYSGKLGGPLEDVAKLIGEVIGVERTPIDHKVSGGKGVLKVGDFITAEMEPYRSADGTATTLRDSIFSTVPGSPAYVSKASTYRVNIPKYNMTWHFEGRNAIQADYTMAYKP